MTCDHKCNWFFSWKCIKCKINFETKFELGLHEMNCSRNTLHSCPGYDVLRELYAGFPCILYELNDDKIINISPSCEKILGYSQQELENTIPHVYDKSDTLVKWIHKNNSLVSLKIIKFQNNWYLGLPI